jgi:hypothetical protein
MNSFLVNLFLYYARFPAQKGVQQLFNKGRSGLAGYSELEAKIKDLPEAIIPEINNYIFSSNFEAVQYSVNNLIGYYLFVDYGEISSTVDRVNNNVETSRMAITVAYKTKSFSNDIIEQLLTSEQCLQYLVQIRNTMLREQQTIPWLKELSKSHDIVPFGRSDLSSVGWSMLFERKAFDMFNAKGR